MARRTIGSVCKPKDPTKSNYIQINKNLKENVVLKPGQYINIESKKYQLQQLERAVAEGKVYGELEEKARARIDRIPEFVLGELVISE